MVTECVISRLEQIAAYLAAPHQACGTIYDHMPLGPLLCEPVSTSKSSYTWDGIEATCPPWLSKLTRVEWHSMWCIYSQVQESRHPQLVYERSVWAQRGSWCKQGTECWGGKVCGVLCVREQEGVADILAYLSLSLLAFESEWQRLQVSPSRLCISVSFKR